MFLENFRRLNETAEILIKLVARAHALTQAAEQQRYQVSFHASIHYSTAEPTVVQTTAADGA